MQVDKFNQNLFCSLLPAVLYFSLVAFSRKYKFFWKTFLQQYFFPPYCTNLVLCCSGRCGRGGSWELSGDKVGFLSDVICAGATVVTL